MRHTFGLMAASLGLLAACSEINETPFDKESLDEGNLVERVIFEAPTIRSIGDDEETRASLSQQGDNAINFAWEATDTVGIYPSQGAQVYFSMANGVGTNVASFDGGGWALKQGATYSCYYPFIGNIYLKRNTIPVSFVHQVQRGVSNYEGVNFLLASEGTSSSAGTLQFNFHMLNTVIRIKAIGLPAGTYTKLTLTVDEPLFVQDGSYSLEDMSIVGNSYSNMLEIALEDFILSEATTEANPVLIYLTSAPVNLAGKTVTIRAYSDNGSVYKCEKTPSKAYEAGAWGGLKCTMEKAADIINFADPEVKRICIQEAHWDTNGDGELDVEEAALVNSLINSQGNQSFFAENQLITTFDEFQYFIGLTAIESSAFEGCVNLSSIVLPESIVSIEDAAFASSGLTAVTIPKNVTTISTFYTFDCYNLTEINVDPSNTVFDSRNNCNAIIETANNRLIFGIRTTVIPDSVTEIGARSFDNCRNLESITIPNSVTSIGMNAFYYCTDLSSIIIPGSVSTIGDGAFSFCSNLTIVDIPEGVESVGNNAFEFCNELRSVSLPNGLTFIGGGAFGHCSLLSDITLPESVIYIGDGAFENCSSLTEMIIPGGVTTINQGTFYQCGLSNVVLPETISTIEALAFFGSGLKSITIPRAVTSIGTEAFLNSSLSSITVQAVTPPVLSDNPFNDDDCPIYVPSESVEAYKTAPGWSAYSNRIFGSQSGVVEPIPGDEE